MTALLSVVLIVHLALAVKTGRDIVVSYCRDGQRDAMRQGAE